MSFANNDQQALREPDQGDLWDALVVPGTLATFYKQGVGGYVLSRRRPFVIDPRTPLLQDEQGQPDRPDPKKSHVTLASIHHPDLAGPWGRGEDPSLEWWTQSNRWNAAIGSVIEFQQTFEQEAAEKIDKYDDILRDAGMSLALAAPVAGPERLIPPYFASRGSRDLAWKLTLEGIEVSQQLADRPLMPVICLAADAPTGVFAELIRTLPDGIKHVFCWRSLWKESEATPDDIIGWLQAFEAAAERDIEIVNMYGGALSIFLTSRGMFGVNSGVGYSESRDSRRLSQTGGAPARYYVPRLHAFFTPPVAQALVDDLGQEWECHCDICSRQRDITKLSSLQLKLHFLHARASEWARAASLQQVVATLAADSEELVTRFALDADDNPRLCGRGKVLGLWSELLVLEAQV